MRVVDCAYGYSKEKQEEAQKVEENYREEGEAGGKDGQKARAEKEGSPEKGGGKEARTEKGGGENQVPRQEQSRR